MFQLTRDPDQIRQAAAKPAQAPHDQDIVGAQSFQTTLQFNPRRVLAARMFFVDPLALRLFERVQLQIEILFSRGHTRIADPHVTFSHDSRP